MTFWLIFTCWIDENFKLGFTFLPNKRVGTWKQYTFESILLFNKKFRNYVYFSTCILPDYMAHRSPKNFEKIAILNILEMVSFWGVKTHFSKRALKWCIFRHEKKYFNAYYVIAFDPIKIYLGGSASFGCFSTVI